MNRLLLDTHIWLWYLMDEDALSENLKQEVADSRGNLWLSPISIWEVGTLQRKGRIRLPSPTESWVREARRGLPVREAALNFEIATILPNLKFSHSDPADHFLAATALIYDLTLVTVDRNLIELPWLSTLSR